MVVSSKIINNTDIIVNTNSVYYSGVKTHILNVGEQVKKEVNKSLQEHGFPVLTESIQKALLGQISEVSSPQHPVHQLMCE